MINSTYYFVANTGAGGKLYSVTGGVTKQASNTNPLGDDAPQNFTVFDGSLYFTARNANGYYKLYRHTPGANAVQASQALTNLNATGSDDPSKLKSTSTRLYFVGFDGTNQRLYAIGTGTSPTIEHAADTYAGTDPLYDQLFAVGDHLYFTALNSSGFIKLFVHKGGDPATISPISELVPGDSDGFYGQASDSNGVYYFSARDSSGFWHLYSHFGAATSFTGPLSATNPGGSDSIDHLFTIANTLYFVAQIPGGNSKLFRYPGASPVVNSSQALTDTSGGGDDQVLNLTADGNTLYFTAMPVGSNYPSLFKYTPGDPLVTASSVLSNTSGTKHDAAANLTVLSGSLYFTANDGAGFTRLYRYTLNDPIVTQALAVIGSGTNDMVTGLFSVGSSLYFSGSPDGVNSKLYRYTTASGLVSDPISNLNSNGSDQIDTANFGGDGSSLYFSGTDANLENHLYQYTPGQSTVTTPVIKTYQGTRALNPSNFVEFNTKLYFLGDTSFGRKLFRYEGANDPTLISNIRPSGDDKIQDTPQVAGSRLYFPAELNGYIKLFSYDGSSTQITSSNAISNTSNGSDDAVVNLYPDGNYLYFEAKTSSGWSKLFVVDSTTNQITQASDTNSNGDDGIGPRLAINGTLYFASLNSLGKYKLYRFTPGGSIASTAISNINSAGSDEIQNLIAMNGVLYFTAVFDGSGNSQKLYKYAPGDPAVIQGSNLTNTNSMGNDTISLLTVIGNTLYFTAWCGNYDRLFKYTPGDPVVTSTMRLSDISLSGGTNGDQIQNVTILNQHLYFTAVSPTRGRLLYRYIPGSPKVLESDALSQPRASQNSISDLVKIGNALYFVGTDSSGKTKLFQYQEGDPLVNTPIVDRLAGQNDILGPMVTDGTTLFFVGNVSGQSIDEAVFKFNNGTYSEVGNSSVGASEKFDVSNLKFFQGELVYAGDTCGAALYSCFKLFHVPL